MISRGDVIRTNHRGLDLRQTENETSFIESVTAQRTNLEYTTISVHFAFSFKTPHHFFLLLHYCVQLSYYSDIFVWCLLPLS